MTPASDSNFAAPSKVARILDANANRAGEGLRVIEDFCRFLLDDAHLSKLWKDLRHDLQTTLGKLDRRALLASRDATADVGTQISALDEYQRPQTIDVVLASQKRVEQSLRCLEEYSKPSVPELAAEFEQIRYRVYTAGRATWQTDSALHRLELNQLYVLLDAQPTPERCVQLCEQLLAAGVRMFQLREKRLDDRQLVELGRLLRQRTSASEAVLIINDRPDIAALTNADGVHLGQSEIRAADARALLGPDRLVGISTHTIQQARQAVLDGADYIGCGPTFRSSTKSFSEFAGLALLCEVSAEVQLPAYAIGGIDQENLGEVLATGFNRVAVAGGIVRATDPAAAATQFLKQLEMTAPEATPPPT